MLRGDLRRTSCMPGETCAEVDVASGTSKLGVPFVSMERVTAADATSLRLKSCGFFKAFRSVGAVCLCAMVLDCIARRSLSFFAAVSKSTIVNFFMRFWLLLSRITGCDMTILPGFFRTFLGGFCIMTGAVLARMGGNSWPCTGTPPMPRSV